MKPIQPCIWLDTDINAAADFYLGVFPGSRRVGTETVEATEMASVSDVSVGSPILVTLELAEGTRLQLLNGGPSYRPSEGLSLVLPCDDQAEIDRLWDALAEGGGSQGPCGWVTDRYGACWQVVPADTSIWRIDDPEAAARVQRAMMTMTKLDLDELRRAGDAVSIPS